MIYAGLTPEDPRVKAAVEWITKFYTVEENPGMGQQGLLYYSQMFAKTLHTMDLDTVKDAVVFRPSILFGPEDGFFNRFADMARYSPVLPLIGGGHTKFQLAYVGDVAEAYALSVDGKVKGGKVYELGGEALGNTLEHGLNSVRAERESATLCASCRQKSSDASRRGSTACGRADGEPRQPSRQKFFGPAGMRFFTCAASGTAFKSSNCLLNCRTLKINTYEIQNIYTDQRPSL